MLFSIVVRPKITRFLLSCLYSKFSQTSFGLKKNMIEFKNNFGRHSGNLKKK